MPVCEMILAEETLDEPSGWGYARWESADFMDNIGGNIPGEPEPYATITPVSVESTSIPFAEAVLPALPARPGRKRESSGVAIALAVSVACHGLAVGLLVLIAWFCHAPPSWHIERGNGIPAGDLTSNTAGESAAGPVYVTMPDLANEQAKPFPAMASIMPRPAEEQVDRIPPEFTMPPTAEESQPQADPILFGARAAAALEKTPVFPKSPTLGQQDKPAEAASGALAAGDSHVESSDKSSTAAAGTEGQSHVYIPVKPAGLGGAGGHGGAADGLDGRGLPRPDYPTESRRLGEQGVVKLDVEVLADGRVGTVKVLSDPGYPRLVAAALSAVRRGHFQPATYDGRPIAESVVVPYNFVLHQRGG